MTITQDKFLQSGSGAVNRTVESKLNEIVSVKDFGAVGDGTTDDTAAIQDAIDSSLEVRIPIGTYKVTSSLSLREGSSVIGSGQISSVITFDPSSSISLFISSDTSSQINNITISDIKVTGNSLALSAIDIKIVRHSQFTRLHLTGFSLSSSFPIIIDGFSGTTGATSNHISSCDIQSNYNGIELTGISASASNANTISDSRIGINGDGGICVKVGQYAETNVIDGNTLYSSGNNSKHIQCDGDRNRITDNRGEFLNTATGTTGIDFTSNSSYNRVKSMSEGNAVTMYSDSGTDNVIGDIRYGDNIMLAGVLSRHGIAASSTGITIPITGSSTTSDLTRIVGLKESSIAGISWRWDDAITAGTYTIKVTRAGTALFDTGAISLQQGQVRKLPSDFVVSVGSNILVKLDTDSSFLPTGSNDLTVFVWVYQ